MEKLKEEQENGKQKDYKTADLVGSQDEASHLLDILDVASKTIGITDAAMQTNIISFVNRLNIKYGKHSAIK